MNQQASRERFITLNTSISSQLIITDQRLSPGFQVYTFGRMKSIK